jgi:hypothetical protein
MSVHGFLYAATMPLPIPYAVVYHTAVLIYSEGHHSQRVAAKSVLKYSNCHPRPYSTHLPYKQTTGSLPRGGGMIIEIVYDPRCYTTRNGLLVNTSTYL